jgi:hypothetical protein
VHERGNVVKLASASHDKPKGAGTPESFGFARKAPELLPLRSDERAPLHEIFGRIAADHLLGQRHERRAVGGRLTRQRDGSIYVRSASAYRGVDVGGGDPNEPHDVESLALLAASARQPSAPGRSTARLNLSRLTRTARQGDAAVDSSFFERA